MFEQGRPEADQIWADAARTIPGVLYWASGSASGDKRWSPMDPARSLYRDAPGPLPSWVDPDYVAFNIAEFQRTGFHGGLNYYRAFELSSICPQLIRARESTNRRFTCRASRMASMNSTGFPRSSFGLGFPASSPAWSSTTSVTGCSTKPQSK
jgi:hypothetical protein